jgi:hypothetical protein
MALNHAPWSKLISPPSQWHWPPDKIKRRKDSLAPVKLPLDYGHHSQITKLAGGINKKPEACAPGLV